ncbi:MAG: FAD-binding oxidoreductase, partial [Mesorhizobium sp.]
MLESLMGMQVAFAERYRDDAAGERGDEPLAIYAPRNILECAVLLDGLNRLGQPCVIQGGRTGLSGGARVRHGEVVLSTERMHHPPVVDEAAGTMRVGAAVTLEEAQNAARDRGWLLAADLGARGSATIGGLIATNAGGPLAIRYGTFRAQVLGIEAVLADGTIIDRMHGLWKDNTGYNLSQMIIGSEGTLAVVTAAMLRLNPPALLQSAALCACGSVEAALAALPLLKKRLGATLQACDFVVSPLLEMSAALRKERLPFDRKAPVYLLIEVASSLQINLQLHLEEALAEALEKELVVDALISQSEQDRLNFWRLRDGCNDVLDRNCAPIVS